MGSARSPEVPIMFPSTPSEIPVAAPISPMRLFIELLLNVPLMSGLFPPIGHVGGDDGIYYDIIVSNVSAQISTAINCRCVISNCAVDDC